ncbi:MAG: outer membrane lipoprotein carrier protein LolA [Bryobacteraceae bacterium]
MSVARLWTGLLAVSAFAADPQLGNLLATVEARYNHAKTLEVVFQEQYTRQGEPHRAEGGRLQLRKPGKMRWDYTEPQGKLFICDGKYLYLYTPADNRAQRMKLKETDDMRAPLAFLLGKLHFEREFRNLQANRVGGNWRVTAEPKTDDLPYRAVEFVVAQDGRIEEVKVTSYDQAVLDFHFDREKVDPPLGAGLFQFQLPAGAQLTEGDQ